MKIMVLGGGGFIGGHLARYLKESGCYVTIVDLKEHSYFKRPEICDEFIITDLRYNVPCMSGYDEVFQLASDVGGAGYIFSGNNDAEIMSNSALININVARQYQNINKLFFSSSSCAYPVPEGNYGHEKLFSEKLYTAFLMNHKTDIRIGRFQNVYGTHDTISGNKERFITAMCRKVSQAKDSIEVWGNGSQKRSFIYVQDCIKEIVNVMRSDYYEPVNIGSEKQISINDMAKLIIDISGKDIRIDNIYGTEFYNKYGFDCPVGISEKTEATGFKKEVSLKGLRETYNWVNEN